MNSLDAAYRVLEEAGRPLNYREITRRMLKKGLWHTTGRTPDYTISRDLSQEIERRGASSRFVRVRAGLYGLSSWGPVGQAASQGHEDEGRPDAPEPARKSQTTPVPGDLAAVVAAWPNLPENAKQEIALIVKRAGGGTTQRMVDPVLAQVLPDGPRKFPAKFLPPDALAETKVELPDEPLQVLRFPDGRYMVQSHFGFALPVRNETEGRYIQYAHQRGERLVVVPPQMLHIFKAVKAYEKYLDGQWHELFRAYGRKYGDRTVADQRTREGFEFLGLPTNGRPNTGANQQMESRSVAPGRARRGRRTPEVKFYRPILEVLAEMGGSGKVPEILLRLKPRLDGILAEADYAPLPSTGMPRWDNTTRWARNSMIRNGLLKDDSPWGVWEISDKGRRLLNRS
jgi:hypothetical protein